MAEKFYSVAEANALLPRLRPLLQRIRDQQEALSQDRSLALIREKATRNGGPKASRSFEEKAHGLERDIEQVRALGIVLRDPSVGLIDFPHQREGRTVFLCWKLGEAKVEWWHPIDTGIAGRQRL